MLTQLQYDLLKMDARKTQYAIENFHRIESLPKLPKKVYIIRKGVQYEALFKIVEQIREYEEQAGIKETFKL